MVFRKSGRRKRKLSMARFTLGLSLLVAAAVLLLGWQAWAFLRSEFPDVQKLRTHYPVVDYRGRGRPFDVRLIRGQPAGWTPVAEVSRVALGAVIVSEDWAFFQHKGYDANQIKEAILEDLEEGRFARGASTITQQVVKNVFLEQDRTLWRKLKELLLAVRLERAVGKRKILEAYLNVAEWGEGIFGIREAARYYFQKGPSQLTAKEGAFLAMLLPSPKRYSESFRRRELSNYAAKTVRSILGKMTQAHYLTEEELGVVVRQPLPFESAGIRAEGGQADGLESSSPESEPET